MTSARPWSAVVGLAPHKVRVYELEERDRTLYLRWRAEGNWRKRSLGVRLRDTHGRIRPEIRRQAIAEAERQAGILSGRLADSSTRPLTVAETGAVITNARTGLYPTETPHAKEVSRSLSIAARIWGADTPWDTIDRARIRALGRVRIDELRACGCEGYRAAEICVQRVLTVAAWLRDEHRIAADACLAPRRWREELRSYWSQRANGAAPEPYRPRHTLDEMRALLEHASAVDPRFALLLALGAELRLGQVARARRSDLDETARTLTIRGRKRGAVVTLTDGQMRAWLAAKRSYLAVLNALPDYLLFPRGQMPGGRSGNARATVERHGINAKPIGGTAIRKWFKKAEKLAKIRHVRGRGAYGLRRVAVDAAKERQISREGLKAFGGWTDTQVPDMVYAEVDAQHARDEAAEIRAQMRGES